jgi:MFS family permease
MTITEPSGSDRLLGLMALAHGLNHSLLVVIPPLIPLIVQSTRLSIAELGLLATLAYGTYGVGSLLGGYLADKYGERKIVFASLFFSGLATLLILLFPDLLGLAAGLLILGIWASFYHPSSYSLLSKGFRLRVGHAFGVHASGGSLSLVFTPILAVYIGLIYGWPSAFVVYGLMNMITGVLILKSGYRETRGRTLSGALAALKTGELRGPYTYQAVSGGLFRSLDFILPVFLVQNRALNIEQAAVVVSTVLIVGAVAQILVGRTSARLGETKYLLIGGGIATAGVLSLMLPTGFLGIVGLVIAYGFYYSTVPVLNTYVSKVTRNESRGAVFGVLFFMFFGVGSISVVIAGWLSSVYGSYSVLYLSLAYALVNLLVTLRLQPVPKPAEAEH